jgi:hypothetical protein
MVNFYRDTVCIPRWTDGPFFYMQITKNTIAIYAPMIYTAPCVILLTRAASITRASGSGLGPGNQCCGSGSGAFWIPESGIRDPGWVKNQDPG